VAASKVGILGLGRIGRVAAANLANEGFAVAAVERPSSRDFVGTLQPDAAALAAASDVVVSALANEAQMEEAFLAPRGLVAGAHKDLIVIEMGTFPVALKRRLADALTARGAAMLDCPISGTPPVVARREAVLFVSGEPEIARRAAPVLDAIAPRQSFVGAFGAGMATKLVANFLVIANTLTTAEAMALGDAAGLDPKTMIEAIGRSFAGSPVFNFRAPIMADRTYQPAAGPARIMWKDLQYIREQSDAAGLASPVLQTALDWYGRLIEAGRGEDEGASVYELLRRQDRTRL
jgi:3-hydroxyisobutyrate dehydrogenase-like beta-hydroxyacid dehydrogenase